MVWGKRSVYSLDGIRNMGVVIHVRDWWEYPFESIYSSLGYTSKANKCEKRCYCMTHHLHNQQ
jgi:hypothetical protein